MWAFVQKILSKFDGVKTYACSTILLASAVVYYCGGITQQQELEVWGIFGPLALVALRSSHGKVATVLDNILEKIEPKGE